MPSLLTFLADGTPAVTRQAVTTGTHLFRTVLEKLVFQVNAIHPFFSTYTSGSVLTILNVLKFRVYIQVRLKIL